jgi:hypothetical protein
VQLFVFSETRRTLASRVEDLFVDTNFIGEMGVVLSGSSPLKPRNSCVESATNNAYFCHTGAAVIDLRQTSQSLQTKNTESTITNLVAWRFSSLGWGRFRVE